MKIKMLFDVQLHNGIPTNVWQLKRKHYIIHSIV